MIQKFTHEHSHFGRFCRSRDTHMNLVNAASACPSGYHHQSRNSWKVLECLWAASRPGPESTWLLSKNARVTFVITPRNPCKDFYRTCVLSTSKSAKSSKSSKSSNHPKDSKDQNPTLYPPRVAFARLSHSLGRCRSRLQCSMAKSLLLQ